MKGYFDWKNRFSFDFISTDPSGNKRSRMSSFLESSEVEAILRIEENSTDSLYAIGKSSKTRSRERWVSVTQKIRFSFSLIKKVFPFQTWRWTAINGRFDNFCNCEKTQENFCAYHNSISDSTRNNCDSEVSDKGQDWNEHAVVRFHFIWWGHEIDWYTRL